MASDSKLFVNVAALGLGDVVQLRTGSPPMIVVEYATQAIRYANWFNSDQ